MLGNIRWGSLALCTLWLAGCGSGGATYPVSGKVTFPDGTPLAHAQVSFESTTEPIGAVGTTDANGVYKLTTYELDDGAIPGEHRVLVMPPPPPTPEHDEASGKPLVYAKTPPVIDPKFSRFETSGLTYTVEGAGTFDITVEKPK